MFNNNGAWWSGIFIFKLELLSMVAFVQGKSLVLSEYTGPTVSVTGAISWLFCIFKQYLILWKGLFNIFPCHIWTMSSYKNNLQYFQQDLRHSTVWLDAFHINLVPLLSFEGRICFHLRKKKVSKLWWKYQQGSVFWYRNKYVPAKLLWLVQFWGFHWVFF